MNGASFTVRDMPIDERPRERMMALGPQVLNAQELLALILGRGIAGESVMTTSQKLLTQFGSLDGVMNASLADLMKVRGLGKAKSTQLLACLEIARRLSVAELSRLQSKEQVLGAEDIFRLVKVKIVDFSKEHLVLLCFDVRQRLIATEIVSVGILDANLVHPREIFTCALKHHAASIVIAHNHPSGDPMPSAEDFEVTSRIKDAGKMLGIYLLDHVVVGDSTYTSFLELGLV